MAPATQYELLSPPTDLISALAYAPESPTLLLVSSWDRNVYLYDTNPAEGANKLLRQFQHRAPVLDVCFGENDNEAFSAGMDWAVKKIDFETGEQIVLSTHEAPVKAVRYCKEHSILISASWDSTLHIHHLSQPTSKPTTISLPSKPYSISLSPTHLVVAMASRLVHIYSLSSLSAPSDPSSPPQPWQTRESSLKFQTRSVACNPSAATSFEDSVYATSSIEGRVAVEYFSDTPPTLDRKYAFKCHRQPSSALDGTDIVYPVNALAFHPVHGSFASGGGDGVVALWDAAAKRRIRQYQKYSGSVSALAWSCDGRFLAVSVGEGFEDGMDVDEAFTKGPGGVDKIFIRELSEGEAKGKKAK